MKAQDISEAMNNINEDFIESANERRKPKSKKTNLFKYFAAAAAAVAVIIGIYALIPSENNGNAELPILVFEGGNISAFGFEGYLAYDISELDNGNPWDEDMAFKTLPVFRNNSQSAVGIAYPGIGEEAMLEKLNKVTGGEHGEIEYIINGDMAKDFINSIKVDFDDGDITINSDGCVTARFNNYDGVSIPDEYSFTYNNTTDGQAIETIAYIYENYGDIIGIENATFVTSKEYTFSGEETRNYNIYDFSGDEISDMLNFAFSEVQLAPNDEGKLMLIRVYDKLSCAEKIGDYPIISIDEAKDMLIEGGYITTVPYEMPGEKYIARVELIYRCGIGENIWMPYYRFLVELPEMAQENGLKNFGAYYVPAVPTEYITGLPLWDGSFN